MATHPFKRDCETWLRKIEEAKKVKHELFGQYADEAMRFFDGAHDFMWSEQYAKSSGGFLDKESGNYFPKFRMSVNRLSQAVRLFGPALYNQNPVINVETIHPPEPNPFLLGIDTNDPMGMMQWEMTMQETAMDHQRVEGIAGYLQHYSNWLQLETNKRAEGHHGITEAIVKGMGLYFTEMWSPPGSQIIHPRSRYLSVDALQKDPDAEYAHDVQWIAIECCHPVNLVERYYQLPEGTLKAHLQSRNAQATTTGRRESRSNKRDPTSFDLIRYWKIYSKNGFGHRLRDLKSSDGRRTISKTDFEYDELGEYCHLVVAKDVPFPLNLPPEMPYDDLEFMQRAVEWETPFWTDQGIGNGWPVSELWFYDKPKRTWPISLVKPAIGELRFVNWCMSFLADRVAQSCTTYLAVLKSAGVKIQEQLNGGLAPFTTVEIDEILMQTPGFKAGDFVQFIQAPDFSIQIWNMVSAVIDMVDKELGTTELVYGMTGKQMRSAEEANVKQANTQIRPDEMARRTEDWLSESAMKEIEAAVWNCEGQDVAGPLGPIGAHVWDNVIRVDEYENIVRRYRYRVAAGSARKPNRQGKINNLNDFAMASAPIIQAALQMGQVGPANAFLTDMAEVLDMKDPERYLLMEPMPMLPPDQLPPEGEAANDAA